MRSLSRTGGWWITTRTSSSALQHHGHDYFIEYELKTGKAVGTIENYVPYSNLPKRAQAYANASN